MKSEAKQRRQASSSAGDPAHVEVGLLLAGEARLREILGGRAAADRHVDAFGSPRAQAVVGGDDRLLELRRQARGQDRLARLPPAALEVGDVARVEPGQGLLEPLLQPAFREDRPVRVRGHREPVGHLHAVGRELAIQLAQRGVLPAHQRDVVDADVGKPADQRSPGRHVGSPFGVVTCPPHECNDSATRRPTPRARPAPLPQWVGEGLGGGREVPKTGDAAPQWGGRATRQPRRPGHVSPGSPRRPAGGRRGALLA